MNFGVSIQSEILKTAKINEEAVSSSNLQSNRNNIESIKREIRNYNDNIQNCQKRIEQEDDKKREIIYKLREIMENPSNHEENLLSNKLKSEQESLYKNKIVELNHLNNNNIFGQMKESINSERQIIEQRKEILRKNEVSNKIIEDNAIEKGRKEIIKNNITFLRERNLNEEGLKYIEELLNNNETNY